MKRSRKNGHGFWRVSSRLGRPTQGEREDGERLEKRVVNLIGQNNESLQEVERNWHSFKNELGAHVA